MGAISLGTPWTPNVTKDELSPNGMSPDPTIASRLVLVNGGAYTPCGRVDRATSGKTPYLQDFGAEGSVG